MPGILRDSIKYYIKVVPHDTTLDEHMPTYTPEEYTVVDEAPVPLKWVMPQLPEGRKQRPGIEEKVWIKCLVGTDGKVSKARVLRSSADDLVKPAIAAALKREFTPARFEGKPIATWVALPLKFRAGK
jgi:protein TonB